MFLSNISDYIYDLYKSERLIQYKELVLNLSKKLNPDGSIAFAYIYGMLENSFERFGDTFYNQRKRDITFVQKEFTTISFKSVIYGEHMDAVMVYKKSSKK